MMSTAFTINETQLKQFLLWTLALMAAVLLVSVPEIAFAAAGEGEGSVGYWASGADNLQKQSDRSFRDMWEVVSTWMLWIGLGILIVSVVGFKGQGWWIAFVVWGIAAWGDKFVDYFGSL